jgi:hypothetical protein
MPGALKVVRADHLPDDIPHFGDDAPEVWRDNYGVICARGGIIGDSGWVSIPKVGTFRFLPSQLDVTVFAEAGSPDEIILDRYYRAALPLALQFFGAEVLHASAVRTKAGVIAFCAISETGKSTTVAALTRRGYPLWADDAVVFENRENGLAHAVSIPCRMRLHRAAADFLGLSDAPLGWTRSAEADAPLAAVCVLQREIDACDGAVIRRLGKAESVTALIPHAYCFSLANIERKRRMMEQYFDLAAHTPIFMVSFAPGFDRLALVLDRIEREIPAFA